VGQTLLPVNVSAKGGLLLRQEQGACPAAYWGRCGRSDDGEQSRQICVQL